MQNKLQRCIIQCDQIMTAPRAYESKTVELFLFGITGMLQLQFFWSNWIENRNPPPQFSGIPPRHRRPPPPFSVIWTDRIKHSFFTNKERTGLYFDQPSV